MQYRQFEGHAIGMGKFSKLLNDDTILRIQGSCDCDEGKLGERNCGWKNRKCQFDVFQLRFLSPNFPPSQSQDLRICNLVSSSNIFENLFLIFLASIFVIQFPPSQSQDPQICDIVSSSNIFENLFLIFSAAIFIIRFPSSQSQDPRIRSCEGGDDENCGKKNQRLRSRLAFLRHLAKLDDEANWPRSTR